ncbi:hypothetical protein FD27_GL000848 [Limosilactobacillus frumenti DSM 13145]|uniref:Small integral membrane protein n=1 Tax=Limosilactobacillus frumenti DSM 13145 TaxID=1423746 RepID=A0A0R1PC31_9LACO|nr:DUF2273 domain-containing protein [Limosilactobacillus frumenti]KRL27098.1 hypothetical protein FD27_GL000848 [Limosilactobacillus frumenti DSM 13145]MBA2913786.1 DUF2273 domain-containing protein [Limosilactobacillus frumenti]QFG72567.1 DUF2273 domain-containing protein [Limosilactobacillus frumenti]
MKLTVIGAISGLIISISWLIWGFWSMLGILLATMIFATIGFILDTLGFSIKKLTGRLTARISQ